MLSSEVKCTINIEKIARNKQVKPAFFLYLMKNVLILYKFSIFIIFTNSAQSLIASSNDASKAHQSQAIGIIRLGFSQNITI